LVALRVFRLTRSTAVPFSVLSRKNMAARRKFVVLELVPLRLLGVKNISSYPLKTGSWHLSGE